MCEIVINHTQREIQLTRGKWFFCVAAVKGKDTGCSGGLDTRDRSIHLICIQFVYLVARFRAVTLKFFSLIQFLSFCYPNSSWIFLVSFIALSVFANANVDSSKIMFSIIFLREINHEVIWTRFSGKHNNRKFLSLSPSQGTMRCPVTEFDQSMKFND